MRRRGGASHTTSGLLTDCRSPAGAREHHAGMRYESTATSLSWIPSEAVSGMTKLPFDAGVAHYDATPPDVLDDLEALRDADRFRFANRLTAWIEVEDGKIVDHGQDGGGMIGSTTMRLGSRSTTIAAFPLPDVRPEPEVGDGWVRFAQTAGGRTGVPTPRRVQPPAVRAGHRAARLEHPRSSRSTPTAGPSPSWSAPARSPATGSTTTAARSSPRPA